MTPKDNEDELLRSVALQNAQTIVLARRRAEEELRRQSEWLRVTLASIGDAVISTDADARVTFLNPVAEQLTGWTAADAAGRLLPTVFHIINEATRDPVENPALRALREGTVVGLANHTILIARDGTETPIDDSAAPIRNDQGDVIGVVLVFRDITERKIAEVQLQRSERELSDFFENATVGLRWTGPDGIVQRVNRTELEMLGYQREEYVGYRMHDFHVDPQVVGDFFARVSRGENVREFPSQMRCKDGSIRDVLINSNVLFEDGKFIHTRTFTLDVTDRKRAEAERRASEDRLRFIMDSMPQKIFTANPHGDVDYMNPQWKEFTGQPVTELTGWNWMQIVHPDDVTESISSWRRAVAFGDEFHMEQRLRRWDGEFRWHVSRAVALHDDRGGILMWVGTSTDIHEQRETATRLRRLAADLSEADRRKTEFLALLAHELRNPLAPLSNALQLVQRADDTNETVKSASRMMERQLNQLIRLVDDLMDVSRISSGKIELRREPVELADLVRQAIETCAASMDEAGLELSVKLPDQSISLYADPVRLLQILCNLLNNAIKYTEPGGRISLTVEHDDETVTVSVKDNGVGIPHEMLRNIFDMFTQVDRTLDRAQGGLGIGLTLVRTLVELHGGTVQVQSEGPGRGSEFVVRLPLTADIAVAPAPERELAADSPSIARRVLVVDDNQDAVQSLSLLLQFSGHESAIAMDGVEAVAMAESFRPEIILLDIGLPRLNGYEAARRIREQPWGKDMVLVALTGWGQDEDRKLSNEAGFDRHLVKPVDHDALLRLLAELPSS
jgi:PAS domain S-box-containing protein